MIISDGQLIKDISMLINVNRWEQKTDELCLQKANANSRLCKHKMISVRTQTYLGKTPSLRVRLGIMHCVSHRGVEQTWSEFTHYKKTSGMQ